MSNSKTPTMYVCEQHPFFKVRVHDTLLQFEKHVVRVHNEDLIADFDALLEETPALALKVKKVSVEDALALVEFHRSQQAGAAKGMFNSTQSPAAQKPLRERDAAFANLSAEAEAALSAKIQADSDIVITEKSSKTAKSSKKAS